MRNKNKKVYFVLILIVLFGISVGYAAMNRVLNISGNSLVKQNTWDIHFENVQIKDGSVTATKEPTIENSNTSVNFSFMLDLPGDYYEFTVDVVNAGSIDAMLDSITKTPDLSETQRKYLKYIIEYQNGEQLTAKQLVEKESFVRLKVRVEYRKDLNEEDLPTITETLNLAFTVNYVQADNTGISVKNNGVFMITVDGLLDDIGTVVTIGTEKFYTIGTEGENVKLLSMYNLYVGGEFDFDTKIWTAYGEEATGMQDSNMRGYVSDQSIRKGTTVFSNSMQRAAYNPNLSYEGSLVKVYVDNYKKILEERFGIEILEARLITTDELKHNNIGCSTRDGCSNAQSFIYSTSYWTGTNYSEDEIWSVDSGASMGGYSTSDTGTNGVRPVIVLNKSDIVVPKFNPVADGSLDVIGTIVTIDSEQFYTIGIEGDNVKLLSMYNLYVGGEYNTAGESNNRWTAYGEEATGIQDVNMKGDVGDSSLKKGITSFMGIESNSYVENYKVYLSTLGLSPIETRLISYDELINLGCTESNCKSAPSWVCGTTYWSGTTDASNNVWNVTRNCGLTASTTFTYSHFLGVRPVIVIQKSVIVGTDS